MMKFIIEVSATTGTDILSQITSSLLHISTIARRLSKQKITNFLLQSSLFVFIFNYISFSSSCDSSSRVSSVPFTYRGYTLSKICSVVKKIQKKNRKLPAGDDSQLFAVLHCSQAAYRSTLSCALRFGRKRKKKLFRNNFRFFFISLLSDSDCI